MKNSANMSLWSEARVEEMIRLFQAGMSASQIARALGKPFTRNSVIGKLHRLRAAGRVGAAINPPHKPLAKPERPKRWQAPKPVKPKNLVSPPRVVYERPSSEHAATLMELGPERCKFIEGEYRAGDMAEAMMCGAPALPKNPYCGHHHAVTRIPMTANSRFERSFMYFARNR